MHDRITADRWCVRRSDLRRLRRDVRRAIRQGWIQPTELDMFDPEDTVYGPTIYTVNEQFIKPVTAGAGNMSWALMVNPKGLQCDLFITHAWQEGIFEFLDKVLTSWPPDAKHAWCCMLANPQNLDISHLIQTPKASPFALALSSATKVLVVPNRHASIYTRLWCAYEAYLAHQWKKIILTASSRPSDIKWALMVWLACAAFGALVGLVFAEFGAGYASLAYDFTVYPLIVGTVLSSTHAWSRAVNLAGTWWSAYVLLLLISLRKQPHALGFTLLCNQTSWDLWLDSEIFAAATFVVFFGVSEVDRLRNMTFVKEAELLRASYSGSVAAAACTCAADAASIRAEIGGDVAKVDRTVEQLIRAGMSTDGLRRAADAGVQVERFTSFGYAFAVLVGGQSLPLATILHTSDSISLDCLSSLNSVLGLCLLVFWLRSDLDTKIFAYLVLQKVVLLVQRPPYIIMKALWRHGSIQTATLLIGDAVMEEIMWALVLALSTAGIHRIACIPVFGRRLAQFLVARGRDGVRKAFFGGREAVGDGYGKPRRGCDEETSSDEDDGGSPCVNGRDSDSDSDAFSSSP